MSRYHELLSLEFPEFASDFTVRDTMLYALGCGAGDDPLDAEELRLVYEKKIVALPSMLVTLAYPGFWYRDLDTSLDHVHLLHASERMELDRPLPSAGRVSAKPRITAIYDRGADKGALVVSRREIVDQDSGQRIGIAQQTALCRSDGGMGGEVVAPPKPYLVPERPPDVSTELSISRRAALIYRLSGDYNPLHADIEVARRAGFNQPVLHGLSTYGHVCRAIMRVRGLAAFMRLMDCRFVAPVFPGDKLTVELWQDRKTTSFRARVGQRVVIDNGIAEFA